MARVSKLLVVLVFALLSVRCAPTALAPHPAPKPTLTAIQVYMNETSGFYESLAAGTALIRTRVSEEQKDASLFNDKSWRQDMTGALSRIREDFQTVSHAPPPQGAEEYHQMMIHAEASTNAAAESLQAWLDSRDDGKLKQAMQQLADSDAGLAQAQKLLDTLLKSK